MSMAARSRGSSLCCIEGPRLMFTSDRVLAAAFHRTLREVYFTEKLSSRVNKRAARCATSLALRQAIERQEGESVGRVMRLNSVFKLIGKSARSRTYRPIRSMTTAIEEFLADADSADGVDTVLICWAQHIESYWIGRYGTLKDWSGKLDLPAAEDMIDEAWQELNRTAAALASVADELAAGNGLGSDYRHSPNRGRA